MDGYSIDVVHNLAPLIRIELMSQVLETRMLPLHHSDVVSAPKLSGGDSENRTHRSLLAKQSRHLGTCVPFY